MVKKLSNLKEKEILAILKKVFLSSTSVKDEDLKLFMDASKKVDPADILKLLLDIEKDVDDIELQRILSNLPEVHQLHIDTFLPLGALLNEDKEKLYNLYVESKAEKRVR
jgi:hypothetical protein